MNKEHIEQLAKEFFAQNSLYCGKEGATVKYITKFIEHLIEKGEVITRDNYYACDKTLSSIETIDTVGNCANCGVEFHIHKENTSTLESIQFDPTQTLYSITKCANCGGEWHTPAKLISDEEIDAKFPYGTNPFDANFIVDEKRNAAKWMREQLTGHA